MTFQLATVLVGGVATIAIFSFLIKENPFFRLFEHIYIGIAAGWGIVQTLKEFVWPKIIMMMFGYNIDIYPDGTQSAPWNRLYLLYLLPMAFGLLYYFIFSVRYGWLAKLVIGFTLGMSAGLALKAFFNEIMPQVTGSFKPLVVFTNGSFDIGRSFNNAFFVVTVLCVMNYFFFSFKRSKVSERSSSAGRWLMMVCFGAFFGSTVMARMALLVERLRFLQISWWPAMTYLWWSTVKSLWWPVINFLMSLF